MISDKLSEGHFSFYLFIIIFLSSSSSLLSLIFKISDLMLSNWVSFLAYPNLFGIKYFVVVVDVPKQKNKEVKLPVQFQKT
jgi:hypothetical protein